MGISPQCLHPLLPLALVLEEIANPNDLDANHYWKTKVGYFSLLYKRWIVGELWHKVFVPEFDAWQFYTATTEDLAAEVKQLVCQEADLWIALWNLLGCLTINGFLIYHQSQAFLGIILENILLQMWSYNDQALDISTAQRLLRYHQSVNRKLSSLEEDENPFPDNYPMTRYVIDVAMRRANQDDQFRKEFYRPMVKQRMRLLTLLRESKPKKFHDGRMEHRGRKSKKLVKKQGKKRA
jgi:hypothetical protein